MQIVKSLVFSLFLVCGAVSFAQQTQPSVERQVKPRYSYLPKTTGCPQGFSSCPDNPWKYASSVLGNGSYPLPDSTLSYNICAIYESGNLTEFLPNAFGHLNLYTTQASGWHSHEATYRQYDRPAETAVQGATAVMDLFNPGFLGYIFQTGSNGCATVTTQLPGFSGWYTAEVHFDNYNVPVSGGESVEVIVKPDGVNTYAKWSVGGSPDPAASNLVPYPNSSSNVQFPVSGQDSNHSIQSRWLQNNIAAALIIASDNYASFTAAQGTADLVNMWRGSLPDGGIADNDSYTPGSSDWNPQLYEEHASGSEFDVLSPPEGYLYASAMVGIMQNQGCLLGINLPGGTGSASKQFWTHNAIMHFVCGEDPLPVRK